MSSYDPNSSPPAAADFAELHANDLARALDRCASLARMRAAYRQSLLKILVRLDQTLAEADAILAELGDMENGGGARNKKGTFYFYM